MVDIENQRAILDRRKLSSDASPHEWKESIACSILGLGILIVTTHFVGTPELRGWLIIIGLLLLVHLGLFGILSCIWRSRGVEAKPLMQSPQLALSLREFWGRRWNTAFRDIAHAFCFLPKMAFHCLFIIVRKSSGEQ